MTDASRADGPRRLKEMLPGEIAAALDRDPRLIIPVGTLVRHGPHLPLGSDTIIAERIAEDLSATFGVLLAPTLEYGVNMPGDHGQPGSASVRRKTLHRLLNDLLFAWEASGVEEFIVLSSHAYDPHQEALATAFTTEARVRVVDLLDIPMSDLLEGQQNPMHGGEADTSLMLYLAPELVRQDLARDYTLPPDRLRRYRRGWLRIPRDSPGSVGRPSLASAERGERIYHRLRDRVAARIFVAPPSADD